MNRRRGSHPYHHGWLREAALAEAWRILSRKGAEAISLRAIARKTGVTPNALYRHFPNKDALLAVLAEEGFRGLTQAFRGAPSRDANERFRNMARAYVEFSVKRPALLKLMFGQAMSKIPRDHPMKQAAKEAFLQLLQGAADAARLPLEAPDTFQLAIACWSLVHGYSTLLTNAALDFVEPGQRPAIDTLTRFIKIDQGSRHQSSP